MASCGVRGIIVVVLFTVGAVALSRPPQSYSVGGEKFKSGGVLGKMKAKVVAAASSVMLEAAPANLGKPGLNIKTFASPKVVENYIADEKPVDVGLALVQTRATLLSKGRRQDEL